jgi:hypothetical protein
LDPAVDLAVVAPDFAAPIGVRLIAGEATGLGALRPDGSSARSGDACALSRTEAEALSVRPLSRLANGDGRSVPRLSTA